MRSFRRPLFQGGGPSVLASGRPLSQSPHCLLVAGEPFLLDATGDAAQIAEQTAGSHTGRCENAGSDRGRWTLRVHWQLRKTLDAAENAAQDAGNYRGR